MRGQPVRKGMPTVPTTLVVIMFLVLLLVVGLLILNYGTGIMKGSFDSISGMSDIIDGLMPGDSGGESNPSSEENGGNIGEQSLKISAGNLPAKKRTAIPAAV